MTEKSKKIHWEIQKKIKKFSGNLVTLNIICWASLDFKTSFLRLVPISLPITNLIFILTIVFVFIFVFIFNGFQSFLPSLMIEWLAGGHPLYLRLLHHHLQRGHLQRASPQRDLQAPGRVVNGDPTSLLIEWQTNLIRDCLHSWLLWYVFCTIKDRTRHMFLWNAQCQYRSDGSKFHNTGWMPQTFMNIALPL